MFVKESVLDITEKIITLLLVVFCLQGRLFRRGLLGLAVKARLGLSPRLLLLAQLVVTPLIQVIVLLETTLLEVAIALLPRVVHLLVAAHAVHGGQHALRSGDGWHRWWATGNVVRLLLV